MIDSKNLLPIIFSSMAISKAVAVFVGNCEGCIPSRSQIQHNLPKYLGKNQGRTNLYALKSRKWQKSYLTTYMDELSTKS